MTSQTTGEDLAAALRRARQNAGLSIRDLAAAAGVSTATVQRHERTPLEDVNPKTLRKITDALGLPPARLDASGVWSVGDQSPPVTAPVTAESPSVVTDGRTVLVLDVPPGFLDDLDDGQLSELKQDALVEILRLARAAKRGAASR